MSTQIESQAVQFKHYCVVIEHCLREEKVQALLNFLVEVIECRSVLF